MNEGKADLRMQNTCTSMSAALETPSMLIH